MCIALLTTAHPKYALILLNNRDEFILRPTSQPHWWTTKISDPAKQGQPTTSTATSTTTQDARNNHDADAKVQHVLSSRDLLRAEQGTWLGITRAGHLAVLTNYRELEPGSGAPSVSGARSRGAIVNLWLGAPTELSVADFVEHAIAGAETQGIGGFSLICGKLRRRKSASTSTSTGTSAAAEGQPQREMEPLALLSNKAARPDEIPRLCSARGQTLGLSNAAFDSPQEWPKVTKGKALLSEAVAGAIERDLGEDELREELFGVLSRDDLPQSPEMQFEDYFKVLHESIFIPPVGSQRHRDAMARVQQAAAPGSAVNGDAHEDPEIKAALAGARDTTAPTQGFSTGMYGTQRQTIILVDWEGNVIFTERSLFDGNGNATARGKGDVTFRFAIDGWDQCE